jgi:hypothetical protein
LGISGGLRSPPAGGYAIAVNVCGVGSSW